MQICPDCQRIRESFRRICSCCGCQPKNNHLSAALYPSKARAALCRQMVNITVKHNKVASPCLLTNKCLRALDGVLVKLIIGTLQLPAFVRALNTSTIRMKQHVPIASLQRSRTEYLLRHTISIANLNNCHAGSAGEERHPLEHAQKRCHNT